MLTGDSGSSSVRSNSPSKRANDVDGEDRPSKRRKVDQADRTLSSRELAPRALNLETKQNNPTPSRPKRTSVSKRSTTLNLKNYPSNHHPVGIAIWILQKVEQARRELEAQRAPTYDSNPPKLTSPSQPPSVNWLYGHAASHQWQAPSFPNYVNLPAGYTQEVERLQAQRNRKTKQRQENWAKNKETDVVARTKIEARKHFDDFPYATDAEQQAWIEEKVRLDFGRLLDRVAAQLNSEIVGIPPYQIGHADYFFNKASNPQLTNVDGETIYAARLIAYVLPALTESVVSPRHQYAADTLVNALVQNAPPQQAFSAAIYMLAQDYQILSGLDKLIRNIFLPKTGSQLARKHASNGSDQSGSGSGLNVFSSSPIGAPVWHWKEPATIANSIRFSSPSVKTPVEMNGTVTNTVVQPCYQDPLPPPIVVQAEVFRPPPGPPRYYQYPYMPNRPPYYANTALYPEVARTTPPLKNSLDHIDCDNKDQTNSLPQLPPDLHAGGYHTLNGNSASPITSLSLSEVLNSSSDACEERIPPESRLVSQVPVDDQAGTKSMSPENPHPPSPTNKEPSTEVNGRSASSKEEVTRSDPALAESSRRRSSRETILTSKAKEAGILLGTQTDSPVQTNPSKAPKMLRASKASPLPETGGWQPENNSDDASETVNEFEQAKAPPVQSNIIASKESQESTMSVESFVPRSSGRERKPTAKILASSAPRSGLKSTDYASSVPRVSSKLRLSVSPQSSAMSEISVSSTANAGANTSLSPTDNTHPSPEAVQSSETRGRKRERLAVNVAKVANRKSKRGEATDTPAVEATSNLEVEEELETAQVKPVLNKNQKFLTNDKGQSMSQALLLMAQVAAEWSDSDDDHEAESEQAFLAKLQESVDKQTQSTQQSATTRCLGKWSHPVTSIHSNTTPWSRSRHDLTTGGDHHGQGPWYQPVSASAPYNATGALSSSASNHQQLALSPNPGPQVNGVMSRRENGPLINTDPRSTSQITDDWISVVRLKDEVRARGLPLNDSMGVDQLTNLLRTHDVGGLNVASKPALKTLAPSTARFPSSTSRCRQMTFSSSDPSLQPLPKHIQYVAPDARTSNGALSVSTQSHGTRPQLTEASDRSHPRRSTPQHTSRYDFNPQGLNGGPPGGGTIINSVVHPKQRQKSKAPDSTPNEGSIDGTRNSTPSTREANSATPQPRIQTPPIPNFKKDGIILSFGKKAARTAAAPT